MKKKLKILDLCCGAGGASMGYKLACDQMGIEVEITGVDINPQPNYPFTFKKADAVKFLVKHGHKFDFWHASPPCQKYIHSTAQQRKAGKEYPDNLEEIIQLFEQSSKPGIIENVMSAPMRRDIVLRGDMFGNKVLRRRKFMLVNWFMLQPGEPTKIGSVREGDFVSVFGNANLQVGCKRLKGFENKTIKESWRHAMGCHWMKTDREISESIPPAYTRYLMTQFLTQQLNTTYNGSKKKQAYSAKSQ